MLRQLRREDVFLFYGSSDLFSNWNWRGFVVKGIYFKTGEHFLMYCKAMLFGDKETAEKILKAHHPKETKYLGRLVKGYNEQVWQEKRIPFMVRGCLAKADYNPDVGELLDSTGDRTIIEASLYDKIWGIGFEKADDEVTDPNQWRGTNYLGTSWMIARELRRRKHVEEIPKSPGNVSGGSVSGSGRCPSCARASCTGPGEHSLNPYGRASD